MGTRRRTPDGNEDEDNGNEDRIGEGGREAKKRKKPEIVVDAVRETGGHGWKDKKNVEKKGLIQ